VIADQAKPPFRIEALAIEGDDAGRFLAAMLERMQAERGQCRRIIMPVNPEDTAFLAQRVAVEIEIESGIGRRHHISPQFGLLWPPKSGCS
jgi:hypothetical protein